MQGTVYLRSSACGMVHHKRSILHTIYTLNTDTSAVLESGCALVQFAVHTAPYTPGLPATSALFVHNLRPKKTPQGHPRDTGVLPQSGGIAEFCLSS